MSQRMPDYEALRAAQARAQEGHVAHVCEAWMIHALANGAHRYCAACGKIQPLRAAQARAQEGHVPKSCPTRLMEGRNEIRCWLNEGHEGECR
jgi:hypothetical protein